MKKKKFKFYKESFQSNAYVIYKKKKKEANKEP